MKFIVELHIDWFHELEVKKIEHDFVVSAQVFYVGWGNTWNIEFVHV